MRLRILIIASVAIFGCLTIMQAQRGYMPFNDDDSPAPMPADANEKTEWAFARLMFPPGHNDGYRGRFDGDFCQGLSLWTQDYPRARPNRFECAILTSFSFSLERRNRTSRGFPRKRNFAA